MQKSRALLRQWSLPLLFVSIFNMFIANAAWAIVSVGPTSSLGTHTISWTPVAGVNYYTVKTTFSGTVVANLSTTSASKSNTETPSDTYNYSVTSWQTWTMPNGEDINTLTVLGIPSSITIPSSSADGSVSVSWSAASGAATRHELFENRNNALINQPVFTNLI